MSQEGRVAFSLIKDLLSQSSQLVIMNEEDPSILYTYANPRAIGGVLMQVQNGETHNLRFTYSLRSDHSLGNHGIVTL